MTGRRGGRILTTCLLAVMCALPATAIGASPFHQVVAYTEGQIESDGVRYAFVATHTGAPLMFDTRRGRTFRPAPPVPDCRYGDIGGGLAFWNCPPPRRTLITDLATGRSWEPAGTEQVDAMTGVYYSCGLYGIGRHWLEFFAEQVWGPATSGT